MIQYSDNEMMALAAGRLIKDGDIVFAGTGVSILAATAAKRIFAPRAVIFFETGGIDPSLDEIPMAVADLRAMTGTSLNSGLIEAFSIVGHRKLHTVAFLGAAQIDRYGNLNSTCIGDYFKPKTRFSGSGGACDVASFVPRCIIFMQHEKRKFPNKVDYLTSPGYLDGPQGREKAGLMPGGPTAVVTNLGVMRFDDQTKEMYLANYYPGITPQKILENMEFSVDITRATEAASPTERELKILREQVDPQRIIL